jgi:hypothetical protein
MNPVDIKRVKLPYFFLAVVGTLVGVPGAGWAAGAGGFLNAGTFALVVELGAGLLTIAAGWLVTKVLGIKIPKILQAVIIWGVAYIVMRVILQPPIPFTLLAMYMGVITIAIFLYISITEPSWKEFSRPIFLTLSEDSFKWRISRYVSFVAFPLLIGYGTFNKVVPKYEEPTELRVVHPAPPASISVKGQTFQLQTAENPYRVDDAGKYLKVGAEGAYFGKNPFDEKAPKFLHNVREGGQVFFGTAGCFFCHGDNLDGRGPFAFAFNPIPANFTDPGTIAQLQETFIFWRVAKGGPGVPRETFPWASAMPPWEEHLTIDDIWHVILFEYWHTGFFPRTWD